MSELIVMVEERSMKALLDDLLPRILPDGWTPRVIPHQGVSDLKTSIPRKLRAWRDPRARFIVMRDNDRGNCHDRKRRMQELVNGTGREQNTRIRIVCQELEAWFLGDLSALENSKGPVSSRLRTVARNPDDVDYPARELEQQVGTFPKVGSATEIAPFMDPVNNLSPSFNAFISAVSELTQGS